MEIAKSAFCDHFLQSLHIRDITHSIDIFFIHFSKRCVSSLQIVDCLSHISFACEK